MLGAIVHVEDDFLFAFGDQTLHFSRSALLSSRARWYIQGYDGDAVHFAVVNFNATLFPPRQEKASGLDAQRHEAYQ